MACVGVRVCVCARPPGFTEAFSEDDVKNAYCFCLRVPRRQTKLLNELHFALVSPAVMRMLLADFGAISRIDRTYPNVKVRGSVCICGHGVRVQYCAHPPRTSQKAECARKGLASSMPDTVQSYSKYARAVCLWRPSRGVQHLDVLRWRWC